VENLNSAALLISATKQQILPLTSKFHGKLWISYLHLDLDSSTLPDRACFHSLAHMSRKTNQINRKILPVGMWSSQSNSASIGCRCWFVTRSKLVPAIIATAIQLSYFKLNSYKQTRAVNN